MNVRATGFDPYYEDDNAIVYCGDSLAVLDGFRHGESFDLIVTDGPYGQDFQSNRKGERLEGRDRDESFSKIAGDLPSDAQKILDILKLSLRKLRTHRHIYSFGIDVGQINTVGQTAEIIWDKSDMTGGDTSLVWAKSFEKIYFGVNASEQGPKWAKKFGAVPARMRRGTILKYRRIEPKLLVHPNEKPVMLLRELIESSSRFGEVVFDPFAGSGSTVEAAILECRKCVAIEIDPDNCRKIVDRIKGVSNVASYRQIRSQNKGEKRAAEISG